MRIIHLAFVIIILCFTVSCNCNSKSVIIPDNFTLEAPHKINCENMFVVGNNLVMINNSGNFLFDCYNLPNLSYGGSFGQLSRDDSGFSMPPSPDLIRILSDTSFVSDNRLVTLKSSASSVKIEVFNQTDLVNNHNIDSILNSKIRSNDKIYARSDLIDGKIYSLFYNLASNNMPAYSQTPEFHVFDTNYKLIKKITLSRPLITFAISNKHKKLYTISAHNENTIQIYDFPI